MSLWSLRYHFIRIISKINTKRRNVSSLWLLLMMAIPLFIVLLAGIVYWDLLPVIQNFPDATNSILLRSSSSLSSGSNYRSNTNTSNKNTTTNNKKNDTSSRLKYSTTTEKETKTIMTTHTPTTQPTIRIVATTYNPPITTLVPTTTAIIEEEPPSLLSCPFFRLENIDFDSSPPPCGAHKCLYRAKQNLGLLLNNNRNNNTDWKVENPISIGFLIAQSDDDEDMVGSWEASEYIVAQYPGRKHFFLDGGINNGDGTGDSDSRPIEYQNISKELVDQLNRGRIPTKSRTKFTTQKAIMVQTVQIAPQSSMILGLHGNKLHSMMKHIGSFIDMYVLIPTATTTIINNQTNTNNRTLALFLSTLQDELISTLRIMEEQPWYVNDWQAIMDHHGQFYEIDVAPRIIIKDKEEEEEANTNTNTNTNNTIRSSLEVISLKKKKKKIESTIRYDRCCEVFQDFYHQAMVYINTITNRNRNMIARNINNNTDTTTSTADSGAAAIVVVEKDDDERNSYSSYEYKRSFCSKSSQTLFNWIEDFDIEAFDRNKDCSHNICTFASLQDDHAAYNVSSPSSSYSSSVNYSIGMDVDVDKKKSSEKKMRSHSKYNNTDNNTLIRNWELAWYISGKYNIHHLVLGRPEYIQIPAVVTTMMTMMTMTVNNNTNNATNTNTNTSTNNITTTIDTIKSNSHIFTNVASVSEFFDDTPVYPDNKGTVLVQRVLRQPRINSVHLFSCTNDIFSSKDGTDVVTATATATADDDRTSKPQSQSKLTEDLKSFVIHKFGDETENENENADENHQMINTKKKKKKKEFFERLTRGASRLAKFMDDPKIKFPQFFRAYINGDGSITLLDLYTMTDNTFNSSNRKNNVNTHNHNHNHNNNKCVKLLQYLKNEF